MTTENSLVSDRSNIPVHKVDDLGDLRPREGLELIWPVNPYDTNSNDGLLFFFQVPNESKYISVFLSNVTVRLFSLILDIVQNS